MIVSSVGREMFRESRDITRTHQIGNMTVTVIRRHRS